MFYKYLLRGLNGRLFVVGRCKMMLKKSANRLRRRLLFLSLQRRDEFDTHMCVVSFDDK